MQEVFVGVDVAPEPGPRTGWTSVVPVARRAGSRARPWHHARSQRPAPRLVTGSCSRASGGDDRLLRHSSEAQGVRFSRVNPRQAHDFAKAMGVGGKTDRVDARMLAELGERLRPPAAEPLDDPARRALQAQATRRRQLVALRDQEATRLQQTADAEARADIKSLIALLDRRTAKADSRMRAIVEADAALAKIDRHMRTVPGVGPIVAATRIAELPELGRLDRRSIAALAGLAPIDGQQAVDPIPAGDAVSRRRRRPRQRQTCRAANDRRRSPGRQDDALHCRPPCVAP